MCVGARAHKKVESKFHLVKNLEHENGRMSTIVMEPPLMQSQNNTVNTNFCSTPHGRDMLVMHNDAL